VSGERKVGNREPLELPRKAVLLYLNLNRSVCLASPEKEKAADSCRQSVTQPPQNRGDGAPPSIFRANVSDCLNVTHTSIKFWWADCDFVGKLSEELIDAVFLPM